MNRHATSLLTLLALLAATVAPTPVAAQQIANQDLFDKSLQVAFHALDQYGRYDNPEEMQRVADIGYRVAAEANYPKMPFTFHLVDMPEPNAFALPGGHIFVTRGLLDLGLTDDMLAALLGHEIAHVVEEHYLEMRKKATIMGVLSQVLMAGVLVAAKNQSDRNRNRPYNPYDPTQQDSGSTGDLVQGVAATSLVVSELLLRSYSRENETEADLQGQRWAAAAGFDPMGAADLMDLMRARIPQDKRYGYWMTHPFFDERVRGAVGNGKLLKRQEASPDDDYRIRTQATLVSWADKGTTKAPPEIAPKLEILLKDEALVAWPRGKVAEGLRLEELHRLRDEEMERPTLSQDFGRLIREYQEQRFIVEGLTPKSGFLAVLDKEINQFERQREDLYPKAAKVLEEGVYETDFLETFLSNYGDAPEVPKVALELGDSHSRLHNQSEAVKHYLLSWETAPESPEGQRAARGLRTLAPRLTGLSALQQLALQRRDSELASIAERRLEQMAKQFREIDNGAEYLRRFPEGPQVEPVIERVNHLAEELLGEVVLYQAVGDHVKAIERINKILTYAPTSEAAEQLRDRAVFQS
jgi:Zn-dependent protease with chaperone function